MCVSTGAAGTPRSVLMWFRDELFTFHVCFKYMCVFILKLSLENEEMNNVCVHSRGGSLQLDLCT